MKVFSKEYPGDRQIGSIERVVGIQECGVKRGNNDTAGRRTMAGKDCGGCGMVKGKGSTLNSLNIKIKLL